MRKIFGAALVATAAFVVVMSSPSIFGLLTNALTLSSVGTVKTVNIAAYSDSACTSPLSSINWGAIEPGSSATVTFYLKNEGNSPVTLSLSTANWSPTSASTYMSITWSYSGEQVGSGSVLQVTLTLTVSSDLSGISSFTVDVIITGAG